MAQPLSGADIQIENGNWTRVHNAILEKLAQTDLAGRELRCLLHLLRVTYGFNRKEAPISLSEWSEGTRINRSHVPAVLRGLAERNIISRTDTGKNKAPIYAFNKYWEDWTEPVPSPHVGTTPFGSPIGTTPSPHVGTTSSPPPQSSSRRIKDNKDNTPSGETDAPSLSLAEQFEVIVKEMNSTKNKVPYLIRIYHLCFGTTNAPDGGALAGAAKQIGSASLLAKYLFDNVSRPPVGPVLPYIIATHKNQQKRAAQMGGNREIKDVQFSNGANIYD